MDYTIKDSSIWEDNNETSLLYGKDCSVRFGVVREEVFLTDFLETRYIVEVWDNGAVIPVSCSRTSRFGGPYNFEEYTLQTYTPGNSLAGGVHTVQPGDQVIVAYANGDSREGFIIGYLNHSGRAEAIAHPDNPSPSSVSEFANSAQGRAYVSEFNGLEQAVNGEGSYRVTYKGLPTNVNKLNEAPTGEPIPAPEYDTEVGGSYFEFDNTGSYLLTDNASADPQSIFMDKAGGMIVITSGKTTLTIDKNAESYEIVNKITTFTSEDEWNLETKMTTIKSEELFDLEAADIKTKGEWAQEGNMEILGNNMQTGNIVLTGNFSNTGTALLAGGANPLIYDIALTIGTGNLGAPVVSSHVLLKTVLTKAT